jgi:methyl-accepting chemotaxis protein
MKDWRIGIRIGAGFAIVIGVCVLLGFFATTRTAQISKRTDALSSNYFPSVVALTRIQINLQHSVSLLLQLVASSDEKKIAQLDAQISALVAAEEKDLQFYESTPFTPVEASIYADSKNNRARFLELFVEVRKVGQSTDAREIARAQQIFEQQLSPVFEKYSSEVQDLIELNRTGANQGMATIQQAVASAGHGIIIGLLLAVVLAIPIALVIARGIVLPLGQAVATLDRVAEGDLSVSLNIQTKDELGRMAGALNAALEKLRSTLQDVAASAAHSNSSSRELAASTQQIASGAQEQAASLEETSASLEQITAAVRQTADNARQASQLATGSRESAEKGQEVVAGAIAAMSEINTASAKISDIISTINEIAFQTNLLAVNAAVEAARAGEEGRGFAVVATEVRSLAQRSAEAAKEIKGLIQDSLEKVEKGSELVSRSGSTLQDIVASVKRVTDIVGEIAAASSEQSTGVDQVNTAITQMDHVTQSNSSQTEELAATAQSLAGQSERLLQLVGTFHLGSDRESSGRSRTHQPPHQDHPPATATVIARRPALLPVNGRPDKPASSAPKVRKQFAHAPVLVGSQAARSEDDSFEEF